MKVPAARFLIAVLLAATGLPDVTYAASPTCVDNPVQPASAAALKPSDVLLSVSVPRAGETVAKAGPDDSISMSVDYWGPHLIVSTGPIDQYHLVYFVDLNDSPYIGRLLTIPHCDTHILHSDLTRVTIDHVSRGSHTLAVLLAGSNNVAVNPPVAASVTFVVQ
jgi:hypothetical protein